MLADIVALASQQKAAAIFLDIDLRDPKPYDDRLQAAIQASNVPVLVPQFFSAAQFPTCVTGPVNSPGRELKLVPLAIGDKPPAVQVHHYFEVGPDSAVTGLCSAYLIGSNSAGAWRTVPAAMSEAVAFAYQDRCRPPGEQAAQSSPPGPQQSGPEPATILPIVWRLGSDAKVFNSSSHERVFRRIAAHLLKAPGATWSSGQTTFAPAANVSFDFFRCAVVIVGSTAQTSADLLRTPIDDMPGALVHANAALSLQDPGPQGGVAQWAFDLLFLLLLPVVTALICWPLLSRAPKGRGLISRLVSVMPALGVALALWLCVSAVIIFAGRDGRLVGAWRFGTVSAAVSMGVVLFGPILRPVADEVEDRVAGSRRRRDHEASRGKPGRGRSDGEP